MSRPNWSVPNRWAAEGLCNCTMNDCASGSYGANSPPAAARASKMAIMPRPMRAERLRRTARQRTQRRRSPPARSASATASGASTSSSVGAAGGTGCMGSVFDTWVEQGVEDVHAQVDDHEQERRDDDHALHHGIVAVEDAGHGKLADPWQGKDRLGQYGAGEEQAQLQSDHSDDRDQGVAQ